MGDVLVCLQVGLEHHTDAHSIATGLSRIDRCADSAAEFELVCLDRNNLNERHLFDKLLRDLVVEYAAFRVPTGTLDVHASNVGSMLKSLRDLLRITFTLHHSVQG